MTGKIAGKDNQRAVTDQTNEVIAQTNRGATGKSDKKII